MARWSDVGSRGVLLSFCKNPGLSLKRHQRSHLWAKDTVAKPTTGAKLRANHSTIDTERVREAPLATRPQGAQASPVAGLEVSKTVLAERRPPLATAQQSCSAHGAPAAG